MNRKKMLPLVLLAAGAVLLFYSFDFLYSVPQISIASIMGRMDSPKSERACVL